MHTLFAALHRRGWTVRIAEASPRVLLPTAVAARYAALPREVPELLGALELCCSADETAWLLTGEDYARTEDSGFRWNECELMALDAAAGDPSWQAEIAEFWNDHFPFMLAVHSDYDYLAVRLSDGAVVHGCAPEWESPTQVASSFGHFVEQFQSEATASTAQWPFSVFLGAPG